MSQRQKIAKDLVEYFRLVGKPTSVFSPFNRHLIQELATLIETRPMPWLLKASEQRSPLETSLLLPAGLHRQVLLNSPETQELRRFYPSVGGTRNPLDHDFSRILLETVNSLQEELTENIENDTIQTNETARGIIWLLPTLLTRWEAIHLVDLGASAGLNLVADQRNFTFEGVEDDVDENVSVGQATNPQFRIQCDPQLLKSCGVATPDLLSYPTILSRSGCDLNPFPLSSETDRAKLKSFVWPDQTERFQRLEEGIEAHQSITARQQEEIAVQPVSLPHGLPDFLRSLEEKFETTTTSPNAPVVIYNTYMTEYLENKGRDLARHIQEWAYEKSDRTVLWCQSEPPRTDEAKPPEQHWCLWTVDMWGGEGGQPQHKSWTLGWVHPHCSQVDWIDPPGGLADYQANFASQQ